MEPYSWSFQQIHFSTEPCGGPQVNFSRKKYIVEKVHKAYVSTQILTLISNMLSILVKTWLVGRKSLNTVEKMKKWPGNHNMSGYDAAAQARISYYFASYWRFPNYTKRIRSRSFVVLEIFPKQWANLVRFYAFSAMDWLLFPIK